MNVAFRVNFINDKTKQLEQFAVQIFESVLKENKLLVKALTEFYLVLLMGRLETRDPFLPGVNLLIF